MSQKLPKADVFRRVLDSIREGKTIQRSCADLGTNTKAFFDAVNKDPELTEEYFRARVERVDLYVDEIVEISDSDPDPHRARNRIDARKWIASKLVPQTYGDRIDLNVNQTIDLGKALADATKRLESGIIPKLTERQVIDINQDISRGSSGSEPESGQTTENAGSNEDDDIFK